MVLKHMRTWAGACPILTALKDSGECGIELSTNG